MEQAREEEIMRITAQFVAEQEAGLRPRLEDYARNYPHYVDEITDFVTYYYAMEVGLPTDTTSVPSLSAGSRAALKLAWKRVNTPLPAQQTVTLAMLAQRQRYSFARLAALLDLSTDIIEQLAACQIDPPSIPQELCQRLSVVLGQSTHVVRQALGWPALPSTPLVAEARASYIMTSPRGKQSFRAALIGSSRIPPAQRSRWLAQLEHEGL
ncbi:MAG TPA: hypothetical protein VGD98_01400 [Ktedonobacteraceae bacterium]